MKKETLTSKNENGQPKLPRITLAMMKPALYDKSGSLACPIKEDLDTMAGRKTVTGSLQEEGKYWVVRGRVYNPNTGKTEQKSKSTKLKVADNTKRKALQMMKEIVALWEQQANAVPIVSDPPFSEYVEKWLESSKRRVRANSLKSYEDYARVHILPALGHIKLRKLQYKHLQTYFDQKLDALSVCSLRKHHVVIQGAIKMAYRDGIVTDVFSRYIELPEAEKFEGTAYDEEQVQSLLEHAGKDSEPIRTVITLAVVYGLRRSEICGLRWSDIDFENGTLTVQNTVTQNGTVRIESDKMKSNSSKRTIWLVESTVPYLKELKQSLQENGISLDKVCVWPDGRPVRPDYLTNAIPKATKRYGLPIVRLHDLRHTAATLLARQAKPKQVQGFLGHSDIKTTMNIYTHLLDDDRRETSAIMDAILKKADLCSGKCSDSVSEVS